MCVCVCVCLLSMWVVSSACVFGFLVGCVRVYSQTSYLHAARLMRIGASFLPFFFVLLPRLQSENAFLHLGAWRGPVSRPGAASAADPVGSQ